MSVSVPSCPLLAARLEPGMKGRFFGVLLRISRIEPPWQRYLKQK